MIIENRKKVQFKDMEFQSGLVRLQAQLAAAEKAGMVEEAVVIKHKLREAVLC